MERYKCAARALALDVVTMKMIHLKDGRESQNVRSNRLGGLLLDDCSNAALLRCTFVITLMSK